MKSLKPYSFFAPQQTCAFYDKLFAHRADSLLAFNTIECQQLVFVVGTGFVQFEHVVPPHLLGHGVCVVAVVTQILSALQAVVCSITVGVVIHVVCALLVLFLR